MIRRAPYVLKNKVRQVREVHKGSILVVEGGDDRRFFERYVDSNDCFVVSAGGKAHVIDLIETLKREGYRGLVGVVDGDFDRIEGRACQNSNVVMLDSCDLEAMLVRSGALERILGEIGSRDKMAAFGRDIRLVLTEAAVPIGCLRLYSERVELGLRFGNMRYRDCVDARTLVVDIWSLIQVVKNQSQRPDIVQDDLVREMQHIAQSIADPWLVCIGDDLVSVLAIGLTRAIGNMSRTDVSLEYLYRALRLAYERADFDKSQVCADLQRWERRNRGFRVFG